jgi:hypothetical protein
MLREHISRQPVWKIAMAGVLTLVLIAALSIAIPSLTGQSDQALAAEIARNSPQVQAALVGGEVQVMKVIKVVDDKGTVVCRGELGVVTAEVDLKIKEVIEVVHMFALTEAEKEKAVSIANADPRVKELLDKGAGIVRVSPAYFFVARMNPETGKTEEFSEVLARVEIELAEKIWTADVNLSEGKVVRLIPPMESYSGPERKVEYFHGEEGPVEEPVFRIGKECKITVYSRTLVSIPHPE